MKTTWDQDARRWVPLTPEPRARKTSPQITRGIAVEKIIKARRKALKCECAKAWPEGTDLPFRAELIGDLLVVANLSKTDPQCETVICSLESIIALHRMMTASDLSTSTVTKRLRSIEVAARTSQVSPKLWDDLPAQVQHALWAAASDEGVADPDDLMHRIVSEGEDGIECIRRWASRAAAFMGSEAETAGMLKARRIVDEIISEILLIWTKTLHHPISWSRTFGVASGPLIRFVMVCLHIVKDEIELTFELEPNAIGQRIQRLLDDAGYCRARSKSPIEQSS
jgi:hypothetical protein